jgi:NTE family protein
MGLERVWDRYSTVLVSDAGAPFRFKPWPFKQNLSWYHRTRRANSITAEQARDLRRKRLFQYYITGQAGGAYWGIGKSIDKYHLVVHGRGEPMVEDNQVTRSLCMIKTRMKKLPEMQQAYLVNWGYALTDAAMRRHMLPQTAGPGQWPFPEYALDDPDAKPVVR